ncbi:MAG: AI-2E family transporter [Polyangiaceae bacterium]|nr:AI-2E family transporter [Polyangiaceae bacterium]
MDLLDQHQRYKVDRDFRLLVTIGSIIGGYLIISYLSDILIPFGIAFVLAYLLNPIATFFQRKTRSRILAVVITFILFLGALAIVFGLLVPRIISELSDVSRFVTDYAQKGPEYWQGARDRLPPEVIDVLHELMRSNAVQELAASAAQKLAPGLWGLVTGALTVVLALMTIVIVLMYLAFLLLDFQRVQSQWKEYLPPAHRETIVEFLEDFNSALSKYFRGQTLVALIVGILFAIGFSIVGIRLAIVLGLVLGVLNMVPYLQNVALVPAFLLALLRYVEKGDGFWWYMIGTALVFVIVQIIQDAILVPKIMGDVTGLRPALIMLSTFVWGKLLGFMGLLLAIPLTVLAVTYYERLLERQNRPRSGSRNSQTDLTRSSMPPSSKIPPGPISVATVSRPSATTGGS